MGYLDNSSITSQFALADDEIDYELWNPAHPLGSDYYGIIIENMPIVESVTDENFSLRYKLLTLPKNTIRIPILMTNPSTITMEEGNIETVVTITTVNGGNSSLGYTVTLLNSDAATIIGDGAGIGVNTDPIGANEDRRSITISTNSTFTVRSKILADNTDISTKLFVVGNETGGRSEIELTVTNNPDISVGNTIG